MPSSKYSKLDDLATKPDNFLECYDLGHSWARLGIFSAVDGGKNSIIRRFFCTRCMTHRDDYFSRHKGRWNITCRRYYYPEGYLRQGAGRIFKRDIHREVINRAIATEGVLMVADAIPPRPTELAAASRP